MVQEGTGSPEQTLGHLGKDKRSCKMKVILYMAMSADGYIAKPDDDTPWSDDEWESFSSKVKNAGNIIIGRRTYEIMNDKDEFEKIGDPYVIVISNSLDVSKCVRSPEDAIRILREKGYDKALVAGGSRLNASFLKQGLIDEIYLDIEPIILGKGIRMFDGEMQESKMQLLETKRLSQDSIQLHYKVVKL